MLRSKLAQTELELTHVKDELQRQQSEKESNDLQDDIDRIALQRELADTKKRLGESKDRTTSLEERVKGLMDVHEEAVRAVEDLNEQLKEERRHSMELEIQVRQLEFLRQKEKETATIIDDLRSDKKHLETELAKLIQVALTRPKGLDDDDDVVDKSAQKELDELRKVNQNLEEQLRELSQADSSRKNSESASLTLKCP